MRHSEAHRIDHFVRQWFGALDGLPEDPSYFLNHVAEDMSLEMPEGNFRGPGGFSDWYALARKQFQPGCDHQIEQLDIASEDQGRFMIDLRVRLKAQSLDNENIDLQVNETWQLSIDEQKNITLHDYRVSPIAA